MLSNLIASIISDAFTSCSSCIATEGGAFTECIKCIKETIGTAAKCIPCICAALKKILGKDVCPKISRAYPSQHEDESDWPANKAAIDCSGKKSMIVF